MKLLALLLLLGGPAAAQSLPSALIWLPPESYRKWSEVDLLLRSNGDLKLTIGLTPGMATPLVKAALLPWVEKGRVELAARPGGDPVLPLVDSHPAAPRPQDALERAVEAREKLARSLGWEPTGFVAGAGALDAPIAASLGASGASFILAGPYAAQDAPWAFSGKAAIVPVKALALPADETWTAQGANVVDETLAAESGFAAAAGELAKRSRPAEGWATAGELAKYKSETKIEASVIADWPAWDAARARIPPPDPSAKLAWDAYGAAAATIERYQNSGSADLRTLDSAVEALRRAQASRFYAPAPPLPEGAEPAEPAPPAELRKLLVAVYKKLKLPAPESLYDAAGATPTPGGASDGPTGVKALSGPGFVEFRAPLGLIALAPAIGGSTGPFKDGGSLADPWRLRALRADWDEQSVKLTLRVGRAFMGPPRPVYDIYVDFNRVLGAGRVTLLEGRGAIVLARDAWELALSIAGDEARLYRARGGGEPEEVGVFKAVWAAERSEVSVSIPRAQMRGTPTRWGWSVVALAEDPARPGRRPAASLVGPDGTILLGVLTPVEAGKNVLNRSNARVPAARLEN